MRPKDNQRPQGHSLLTCPTRHTEAVSHNPTRLEDLVHDHFIQCLDETPKYTFASIYYHN